jgi:hypothetical protein
VAIKEAAIQSIRSAVKNNAEKKKTKDQRHLNKARAVDHDTAGEILTDLALKDAKRRAAKLARDHWVSKKAGKNSLKECLSGSSKTFSTGEEVETFYYDASEGCSEFKSRWKYKVTLTILITRIMSFLICQRWNRRWKK